MSKKIALALSGGVDSSVAAFLLKEAGADLTTVFMRFYGRNQAEKERIKREEEQARAVAKKLDLDFKVLDYDQVQEDLVVKNFVQSYARGESPNPCIICNRDLKFGHFLTWANKNNYDLVASGHYAKIIQDGQLKRLAIATDKSKDQSYFLSRLKAKQLKQIIFPLAALKKERVKTIAQKNNLLAKEKTESFDVCFLNKTNLATFLANKIKLEVGPVVDSNGFVIGQHQGAAIYTIGQRQGFQIDHQALKNSQAIKFEPQQPPALFVIAKDTVRNQLVVGEKQGCFKKEFLVRELSFINQSEAAKWQQKKSLSLLVKVRHTGQLIPAQIEEINDQVLVKTQKDIFALAPGQTAAFYRQELKETIVIGAATIDSAVAKL